jgi:D-ribulokinase
MDHRAQAEAEEINAGGHPVLDYVGGRISPEMETPKLLWLARHLPQSFAGAAQFFDLSDYLTWRATGNAGAVVLHGHLQMDLPCA